MYDIDLHIIHFNEPQWMLDRCIASLDGQPVNIHIVQGVEEWPPFSGRKKGFSQGSAKYCSFVDPDDIVKPGAFEKLIANDGPDLIWGNEEVISEENGSPSVINRLPHHAYLIKRSVDIDYSTGFRSIGLESRLSRVHVNEVIYTWNYFLGTLCRRNYAQLGGN